MNGKVIIERVYLPTETLGSLYYKESMLCKTMELPWKNNQRSISCIPEGDYIVTKEPPISANDPSGRKERPYWHFRIHNVPGRSGVLIHKISYVSGLLGCIGVGKEFKDLNNDGVPDIIRSGEALQELVNILPDKFTLTIKKKE
jgi:hypothetical protein